MTDYYQAALIVTGPRDGELIYHSNQILEILVPPKIKRYEIGKEGAIELLNVEKLTFKRITYKVAMSFETLDCYVPIEWTQGIDHKPFTASMVLGHLLKNAFKGAKGIRRPGS